MSAAPALLNALCINFIAYTHSVLQVKEKLSKMYNLEQIRFEDIFAGPPPTFAVTQNKKVMNRVKGAKLLFVTRLYFCIA